MISKHKRPWTPASTYVPPDELSATIQVLRPNARNGSTPTTHVHRTSSIGIRQFLCHRTGLVYIPYRYHARTNGHTAESTRWKVTAKTRRCI